MQGFGRLFVQQSRLCRIEPYQATQPLISNSIFFSYPGFEFVDLQFQIRIMVTSSRLNHQPTVEDASEDINERSKPRHAPDVRYQNLTPPISPQYTKVHASQSSGAALPQNLTPATTPVKAPDDKQQQQQLDPSILRKEAMELIVDIQIQAERNVRDCVERFACLLEHFDKTPDWIQNPKIASALLTVKNEIQDYEVQASLELKRFVTGISIELGHASRSLECPLDDYQITIVLKEMHRWADQIRQEAVDTVRAAAADLCINIVNLWNKLANEFPEDCPSVRHPELISQIMDQFGHKVCCNAGKLEFKLIPFELVKHQPLPF